MKNYLLVITFNFILLSFNLFAQWQPDVRLTNNDSISWTSNNNGWSIAASGDIVHVVWYDFRDGNNEIYYKRSTDVGISWGADIRLTNNSANSFKPSISVSVQIVHVVWEDDRDGNDEIYYKRSSDGGINWGVDTRLTNNTANSYCPSVSSSGLVVQVVWEDNRDGNYEIYCKRSTDGGLSWGADTRLTNDPAYSIYPSGAISGQARHVVWEDLRDGNLEIYYKRSSDGGISWGADTRLTNNPGVSDFPSVSVSGTVVHVVWQDNRDGNDEIYYKHSTDEGISWGADTRLTNDTAESYYPSISSSGLVVHTVWYDFRDGNSEIYYKRSTDGGSSWEADTRLTNNPDSSEHPSVTASGSVVHVVWRDKRDGNYEIYYKRDPTGNAIGIINFNSEIPKEFKLEQNYPNPFNPTTSIKFQVASSRLVKLVVYDILGKVDAELVNKELQSGTYEVKFDGSNFASGVYFYILSSGEFRETKKSLLLK